MRHRLMVLAATAAIASVPAVAIGSSQPSPTAHAACMSATIAGQHKCIARGQFCKRTAQARRDYRRYGLDCTKRDRNGRYHLQ